MDRALRKNLEREIADWPALNEKQELFEQTQKEWVFRGQSDGSWKLCTTLERTADEFDLKLSKVPDLEIKLIHEFMRRYHLYAVEPPPRQGDTLDWLALMRHHGTPTRLLDFTFSFLVAAYFALEDRPNGDPVVWAVNKSWLTDSVWTWAKRPSIRLAPTMKRLATYRDGNAFRDLFLKRQPKLVCPISPFRLNQRLTVQKGVFLSPGSVQHSFQANLEAVDGH